jgi:hypothetical protein
MASAESSALWARRNSVRWPEPISSSPSTTILRLSGSVPAPSSQAAAALVCTTTPALSSAVPRP